MNLSQQNNDLAETMTKIRDNMSSIKNKILVMSGKGGVGKSTVAVNLATALAYNGYRTGLMDVDLHGPSVVKMVGLVNQPGTEGDRIVPPEAMPNLRVISLASFVDSNAPVIWRGPMKTSAIYQFLGDVAWGELDFLIIDAPPGTGDEPLTVLQTLPDIRPLMVTTPQQMASIDVVRALSFVKAMNKKTLGIVENMSYMKCPNCGEEIKLFGEGGGQKLAKEFEIPLLGNLPFDPQVVLNSDNGKTIMTSMRDTCLEKAYMELTAKVLAEMEA